MRHLSLILFVATFAAAIGLVVPAEAETKRQPVEHHIFLHLVEPADGDTVRIIVKDRDGDAVIAPVDIGQEAPGEELAVTEPADVVNDPSDADLGAVSEDADTESETALEIEETELDMLLTELEETKQTEEPEQGIDLVVPTAEELVADVPEEAITTTHDEDKGDESEPDMVASAPPYPKESAPKVVAEEEGEASTARPPMGLLLFIFVLAIFLGFELISKVPSQLHTPLMSGSNAISGITIVGALAAAGLGIGGAFGTLLGTLAVTFATINVVGGYLVTNRMLGMFKKKDGGAQ